MSDSDRSERRSTWVSRVVACSLVILALAGASYGLTQQFQYEQAADNNAEKYASHARAEAHKACVILPVGQQPQCFANAEREQNNQAREKRREYDDLVAQQTSALWTNIMGLAAITGMILSVIGVWLVYATFQATRQANTIAQQSHIAQTRAWLIVEGLEVEWRYLFEDGQLEIFGEVWFVLKNTGNSAASDIWTRSAVGHPQGIWESMWIAEESPLGPECLPPHGTARVAADFAISMPLKSKGNIFEPQAACIQIAYNGGGTERFMTESIWTISSWSTDAKARWTDACFPGYAGKNVPLDAYGHFGYFRTVT